MELEANEIIKNIIPDANISLSHSIGKVGLIERENATIINAALANLAARLLNL